MHTVYYVHNALLQVSMNFTENKAVIGSTIYSSGIALCSWFSYYPPHFNASSGLRWPFISYGYVHTHVC